MMKGLLLFLALSSQLFAQKGLEVEYEEVAIPRILDKNGNDEKLSDELLEALSVPKYYLLQIKDSKSNYSKTERVNNSQSGNSVQFFGVLSYNIQIDFAENQSKQEWLIESKKYIVVDTISRKSDYQLTREKSTFLGFNTRCAF